MLLPELHTQLEDCLDRLDAQGAAWLDARAAGRYEAAEAIDLAMKVTERESRRLEERIERRERREVVAWARASA